MYIYIYVYIYIYNIICATRLRGARRVASRKGASNCALKCSPNAILKLSNHHSIWPEQGRRTPPPPPEMAKVDRCVPASSTSEAERLLEEVHPGKHIFFLWRIWQRKLLQDCFTSTENNGWQVPGLEVCCAEASARERSHVPKVVYHQGYTVYHQVYNVYHPVCNVY